MKFSSLLLFISLVLCFYIVLVHGKVDTDELLVGAGNSVSVGGAECGKKSVECKEGNGGTEGSVFENEDYIYTNSLP